MHRIPILRNRPLALVASAVLVTGALTTVNLLTASPAGAVTFESSPVGFASMNGGTTGGAGGTTVTVTNASQLDTALQSSAREIIRVQGMISTSGMHKVTSNKSILGVGSNSGITGGGINVSNVSNVIIRNMVFTNADDDSINVELNSHNVWIDHNDLSNGFDGLCDIKRGSDFVTVSWNHFHNHDKTALLGHDDGNGAQDIGHLRVTYVHNWFDGTTQRHPRVRFGNPVHVLNNYYIGNGGYGIASTENAGVLSERNSFENVSHPTVTQTGDSDPGNLRVLNDQLVNSGTEQVRQGAMVAAIPYSYTAEAAANVKRDVTAGAGVGKIGL